MASVSGVARIS